ncbi:hypothetical protein GQ53DRAFT_846782 [Thozetella sp. PMI_491]|nr:hypothetical protein GQ53DRAFT_846782 [Thozetella sp. PMI_491]
MHLIPYLAALATVLLSYSHAEASEAAGDPRRNMMAQLKARATGQDLSFCWNPGSICDASSNLYDKCRDLLDSSNMGPFYTCLCGNGYVPVNQACTWCQEVYEIGSSSGGDTDAKSCASVGVSVAPFPSSILSQELAYNASYTGTIRGATGTRPTPTGPAPTAQVVTMNGGAIITPTPAAVTTVIVTAGAGAGGSNAAPGLDLRTAVVVSWSLAAIVLGFTVLV